MADWVKMMNKIEINFNEIPDCIGRDIGRTFYELVTEFYKDPKNVEAFEKWNAEREEKSKGRGDDG